MLYLLTGAIESGKTSWLKRAVAALRQTTVPLNGFITPAVFEPCDAGLEKVAIDCLLLPEERLLRFGWRQDLGKRAPEAGGLPASVRLHKDRLELRWRFDDDVMRQLNDRLAGYDASHPVPGLFLVDELGFLEFRGNGGVTEALRILDEGCYEDAIAVMRPSLLDEARKRWSTGAGGASQVAVIEPNAALDVAGMSLCV
jgi:hypothetical protein